MPRKNQTGKRITLDSTRDIEILEEMRDELHTVWMETARIAKSPTSKNRTKAMAHLGPITTVLREIIRDRLRYIMSEETQPVGHFTGKIDSGLGRADLEELNENIARQLKLLQGGKQ